MFVNTTGGTVEVDDEDDDELPAPKGPPLVVLSLLLMELDSKEDVICSEVEVLSLVELEVFTKPLRSQAAKDITAPNITAPNTNFLLTLLYLRIQIITFTISSGLFPSCFINL